ncbi:unnamed protein product, partial [Mesorhabditis spiculigera]
MRNLSELTIRLCPLVRSFYTAMPKRNAKGAITTFFSPTESKKAKVVEENTDAPDRDDRDPREWKFAAWNVAGLRAFLKKDGVAAIKKLDADIVLLEETKYNPQTDYDKLKNEERANLDDFKKKLKDYHIEWCASTEKKGYAGVALLTKVVTGLGDDEFDGAGRVIFAEYSNFHFVGAYVMNSGAGLKNLKSRQRYEGLFLQKIKELDATKPVVYGGDLNVAHHEIDLKNPESNRNKTAGFTDEERECFTQLLDAGFKDTFRTMHPDTVKYSYFSFRGNARQKNIGWRLDYWVVSERLMENVLESDILTEEVGSDHVPVVIRLFV